MPPHGRQRNDLTSSAQFHELRKLQHQLGHMIRAPLDNEQPNPSDINSTASLSSTLENRCPLSYANPESGKSSSRPTSGTCQSRRDSLILNADALSNSYCTLVAENEASKSEKGRSIWDEGLCEPIDAPRMMSVADKDSRKKTKADEKQPRKSKSTDALGMIVYESDDDEAERLFGDDSFDNGKSGKLKNGEVTPLKSGVQEVKEAYELRSAKAKDEHVAGGQQQKEQEANASEGHGTVGSRISSIFKSSIAENRSLLRDSLTQRPNFPFFQKDKDKDGGSLSPGTKWWHAIFLLSFMSMLACLVALWAPYPIGARMSSQIIATMPWSVGCQGLESCICPRETICADDLISMIFLTIARSTAWFGYPIYMMLFMSKADNLNNFLQRTVLRVFINFSDYHHIHSLFGVIVGLESASHGFFHLLRWTRRGDDIQLLWTSKTGITGLIAIVLCPFIVLPMSVPYLKSRMPFEWRKGLHYLSLIWGATLTQHAPQRIFWFIGIPFVIYSADKIIGLFFKTHLIESAYFHRLGNTSCIISFENPPGFGKQNSAYVYLMLPWLSKYQFHAFTIFPCTEPNHSSICVHKCGDWTKNLMETITIPTHKPAFVSGPFLSPFSTPAMDIEHLVAVASGIGVTPAISLIKQYSSTFRRLNLIWICRDAGLVEHFLQNVKFGTDGYTLIYYTGKERNIILQDDLPPNVCIFNGRPNLERTISGIISSIATGEGLPERLQKKVLTHTPAEMRSKLLLKKALSIYTMEQLYDHAANASISHNEGLEFESLVGKKVNYLGLLSTMKHLLGGDYELVKDNITKNFENVNTNHNTEGQLGRDEFGVLFALMHTGSNTQDACSTRASIGVGKRELLQRMDVVREMFDSGHGASEFESKWKDEFGIKNHLQGDGKFAAKNWNMLYCGGSQPVLNQLKAFKRRCGIDLSVEKFDW